jgi:hypothetical protein
MDDIDAAYRYVFCMCEREHCYCDECIELDDEETARFMDAPNDFVKACERCSRGRHVGRIEMLVKERRWRW